MKQSQQEHSPSTLSRLCCTFFQENLVSPDNPHKTHFKHTQTFVPNHLCQHNLSLIRLSNHRITRGLSSRVLRLHRPLFTTCDQLGQLTSVHLLSKASFVKFCKGFADETGTGDVKQCHRGPLQALKNRPYLNVSHKEWKHMRDSPRHL